MFGRREWILLAGLLIAYNINLRQVSSHDTYASRFVPISLLRDGDLTLDEFVPEGMKARVSGGLSDNFIYVRGHFFDSHPPVGPLLALPVYALPAWIGIPSRTELAANLFSKLAASLMAALSAVVLFSAARRLLEAMAGGRDGTRDVDYQGRVAMLSAVAFGLATSVWSTASLAMWTHTPAVLGYAVALWAFTCARPGLAGAAVAAAWFARPATAPAVAVMGLYVAHRAWFHRVNPLRAANAQKDVLRFAGGAVLVGAASLSYNYWLFRNLVGGAPFRTEIWFRELGTRDMFSGSLFEGFAGLTVSPNRGLLIFSPVVVVAVYGAWRAWRSSLHSDTPAVSFSSADATLLTRYASLAAAVILLTYSKFIAWWGGHGYGPRYLTDAMPFVGLLFAPGFFELFRERSRASFGKIAAAVTLAFSIFIQAVGAFCWPSAWTLDDTHPYRYRLWDWHETEIEVCLKSGPRFDPAARQLFPWLRSGTPQ
jgi:hypothetical protein